MDDELGVTVDLGDVLGQLEHDLADIAWEAFQAGVQRGRDDYAAEARALFDAWWAGITGDR